MTIQQLEDQLEVCANAGDWEQWDIWTDALLHVHTTKDGLVTYIDGHITFLD